jgi:adenine-specific DNA-methyltransferase
METKKYLNWSKENLIAEIKSLKETKKFGIVWEESIIQPEQVIEICKEKIPILHEDKKKEIITNKKFQNHILIKGDNYHALSILNYTHESNIDFIYIDPPYNTGARDWKYNNDYVDLDDGYRHSKWLSMMNSRLLKARDLLKPDGIICVTIDDYEASRLWGLLDQIFGEKNHLGTVVIRNNPKGRKTQRKVSLIHEYAIFYGRSDKSKIKKLNVEIEDKTHKYTQDKDGDVYLETNLRKQGADSKAKYNKKGEFSERYYLIYYDPKTGKISSTKKLQKEILPIDKEGQKRIWRRSKEDIDSMYEKGDLFYKKTKYGDQIYFKFRGGLEGEPPQSIWMDSKYSASEHGTQMVDKILGERESFPYPKSHYAVMQCIKIATLNKNANILDFFAGAGTTGHAVLELNKEDQGNRKFILCTNNEVSDDIKKELIEKNATEQEIEKEGICEKVCYPRIKNLIQGYDDLKEEQTILYEKKLTPEILKDVDIIFEKIELIEQERKKDFDNFKIKIEENKIKCIGSKKIKGKQSGHGANLKYFTMKFVDSIETDNNKYKLSEKMTEILCLKEDCFEAISSKKSYKIFKNQYGKYLGIILDEEGIVSFKQEISKLNGKVSTYIFSFDQNIPEEEFEDVLQKIDLKPIPEGILNIHRRMLY